MGNDSGVDIRWHTITYRTLLLIFVLLVAIAALVVRILHPQSYTAVATHIENWFDGHNFGGGSNLPAAARQAHFVNIEGEVQVRKAGSVRFTPASMSTPLDRGDTVQTQESGWARMQFADGTTYVLKPSSLIVIEENRIASDSSEVAVNVTSGMVDLATGQNDGHPSTSRVKFADAAAALGANSRAEVDTRTNGGSLTLLSGAADVRRGREAIRVQPFQRLDVKPGEPMGVQEVVHSPQLLMPGNLSPVLVSNPASAVTSFSWTAVPEARHYRLRLSQSPFLATAFTERTSGTTTAKISGLPLGSYYWSVYAIDEQGRESELLEISKFTIERPMRQADLKLTVDRIVRLGRVVEIDGHTDSGAKVLVNDEVVGLVESDGSFKHLTAPYPKEGSYTITVTAEDNSGRIAVRKRKVEIE